MRFATAACRGRTENLEDLAAMSCARFPPRPRPCQNPPTADSPQLPGPLSSSPTSSGSGAARSKRSASSATSTRSSTDVGIRSTALTPARSRDKRRGQERSGERAGRTASMRQHPRHHYRRAREGATGGARSCWCSARATTTAAHDRSGGTCCSASGATGGARHCWSARRSGAPLLLGQGDDDGRRAELLADARPRGNGGAVRAAAGDLTALLGRVERVADAVGRVRVPLPAGVLRAPVKDERSFGLARLKLALLVLRQRAHHCFAD